MTPDFARRLAETVAWCSRHAQAADAGTSTRTPALMPPVMAQRGYDLLLRLCQTPFEATAAVEHVCQARRRELNRLGVPVPPVGPDLAGGRVLFTRMDSDCCAAATDPSNGYFDLDDLPGWDTWFYHGRTDESQGAIYCWVPEHLIDLAYSGLCVIPVQSVEWAESLDVQPFGPP